MYRQGFNILKHYIKLSGYNLQNTERQQIHRWVAPTLRELYRRRKKIGPPKPEPRSSFLEWNYDAEVFAFGKRLSEQFNKNILKRALIHRSYARSQEDTDGVKLDDNSELIKAGYVIIEKYLYQELSKKYPDVLAKVLYDHLLSRETLSYVASHIGLRDIILSTDFPVEDTTLADSFAAVVAALEESSNLERAQQFVKDFLIAQLNGKDVYDMWKLDDAYSYLKNMLNDKNIEPRLCNESATSTILANYQVGLYSGKKLLGIGFGESIDIAKHTAALDAIQRIFSKNNPQH